MISARWLSSAAMEADHLARMKTAFAEHWELEFPTVPADDALADWIVDLAEVDGHYAGLASSALGGKDVGRKADMSPLKKLEQDFRRLTGKTSDRGVADECRDYLKSLRRLADLLTTSGE